MTETAKLEALIGRLDAAIKLATSMDARGKHPTNIYNIADEALDALRALSVSRPAVKGLEWSSEPPYSVARLFPLNGFYSTEWVDAGVCELRGTYCKGDYPTVQSAKAAAQSDFEQRILSSLSPPTGGWKPIESAPRDGTHFLAHYSGGFGPRVGTVKWDTSGSKPRLHSFTMMTESHKATHWQPLPSPPEAE